MGFVIEKWHWAGFLEYFGGFLASHHSINVPYLSTIASNRLVQPADTELHAMLGRRYDLSIWLNSLSCHQKYQLGWLVDLLWLKFSIRSQYLKQDSGNFDFDSFCIFSIMKANISIQILY
jgi:hypothetical protein